MKNRFKFRCWIDNKSNEEIQKFLDDYPNSLFSIRYCRYYIYSNILWGNEVVTHLKDMQQASGLSDDVFGFYLAYLDDKIFNSDYVLLNGIIEQCTSTRDENSQLVYEGDILKYKDTLYVVKWDTNFNRFVAMSKWASGYNITSTFTSQCKIVGNIHEDREFYEKNH